MSSSPGVDLDLPGVSVVYQAGTDQPGQPEKIRVRVDLPGATGDGQLTRHGEQWRGVVQMSLGPMSVAGFAILDLDERQPGMLVLLAAEFTPPIQLSFGFTLVGVGGVVGVNRTPDHERLRETAVTMDLARVLFPRDPQAEADRLLPVIDACFGRRPGGFVVGPTVKIGWTAIVSATVAVLVSDRDVTLIGRIAVGLPFEQLALVRLEANVVGRADANGLAIDATLANSHIVGIPVDGDIRLRMLTSGGGMFALSAGGFHPAFPAPEGMAGMRRVGMHLSCGSILHARLEAYVAVTTNSAQFGARVDLQVGDDDWGVQGHASFDALFLFDPFRFDVGFTAMVAVRAAGIDVIGVSLAGRLAGPAPWRISGHATIKLLFVRVSVPFPNLTWGDEAHQPLPPAPDPVAELAQQLERPENWSTIAAGDAPFVRLQPQADTAHHGIHPWATIGFRQRRVPLGKHLTRMDGIPLGTPLMLTVECPTAKDIAFHDEAFIQQRFFEVDDNQRLSGAGYSPHPGGFDLPTPPPRSGTAAVQRTTDYQVAVREGGRDDPPVELRPAVQAPPVHQPGLSHPAWRSYVIATTRIRWMPPVSLNKKVSL